MFLAIIKQTMKKSINSKALYNFAKKQKNKDSTSTKDLNDSLETGDKPNQLSISAPHKNHNRAQSCPSVEPVPMISSTDIKLSTQHAYLKEEDTIRSQGEQLKRGHRVSRSQPDMDSLTGNQCSVSIESLSSILYRKNSKECSLKKSRIGGNFKSIAIDRHQYEKVRVEQQIKKYQLNQELTELQKRSKGIALKQQILQNLLGKFGGEDLRGSQEELLP